MCLWRTDSSARFWFLCISQPLSPSVHDPKPLYSPVQHACLHAGICVMLQWLVSVAEVVLWPWPDTDSHKRHTEQHSHFGSVPSVINSLFCISQHPSACPPLLLSTACLSLSPFPAWCAVKTTVKHSLISPAISPGNPNEKILPTFSLSCHTAHHKC